MSNAEIRAEKQRAEIIALLREHNERFARVEAAVIEAHDAMRLMAMKNTTKQ